MGTTELFLLATLAIFTMPYLIWRLLNTDQYAPLVVVQIVTGIVLGPGVLGSFQPDIHHTIFNPMVMQTLNGIAWWAVMLFVMLAGVELDLQEAWKHRHESTVTAVCALGLPLILGCIAASLIASTPGWIGANGTAWQFRFGTGMACAVTALPILILLMDKLGILRTPLGQRILRYASLDDVAIWAVLALILMDWTRVGRQIGFLFFFTLAARLMRVAMRRLLEVDRWHVALIWLALCAFAADWSGLHFMVGAFLSGVVMDAKWFNQAKLDAMRQHVLLLMMPVFFLSTGLKTNWTIGGFSVFVVAGVLLLASVAGKLLGVHLAGRILNWKLGDASIIAWLLQTKALIMIIFVNVLLDKGIITDAMFTALLLMAVASTMLSVPMVAGKLSAAKKDAGVAQTTLEVQAALSSKA